MDARDTVRVLICFGQGEMMTKPVTLGRLGLPTLALPLIMQLGGCAAATTASWSPAQLQERAFHQQSVLGLCKFEIDAPLSAREAAYARVYQYALSHSRAFSIIPKGRLAQGERGDAATPEAMAQMNRLSACIQASVVPSISIGFSKHVVLTTKWHVVGPQGWKLDIETQAKPPDNQGMFPNVADPKMEPLLLQLAWDNANQFAQKLAEQGMTPDVAHQRPTAPAAGPVPPNAIDWIVKDAIDLKADDAGENEKLVVVVYYEYGARVPNTPVYFVYYDSKIRRAVAKTVATDQDGVAKIAIPSEADGSSSVFAFSLRDDLLPMVRAHKNQAIRIPSAKIDAPGAGRKVFIARTDSESREYADSFQLMLFPTDGTDLASHSPGDVIITK
jgi:hypothetical protein